MFTFSIMQLYSSQDIGIPGGKNPTATLVLGLIKKAHVREDVLTEGGSTVDPAKLRPVGRLGGKSYSRLLEAFDISGLSWTDIREDYEKISRALET
jgi:flavin reductase (DIM6/NTAB) family NADH-FMN oxidoreductase RutF